MKKKKKTKKRMVMVKKNNINKKLNPLVELETIILELDIMIYHLTF